MSNYLNLAFVNNLRPLEQVPHYDFRNKPFSNSDIFLVTIENFELLTQGHDVKRVYDLKLSRHETFSYNFLPGDTIGILPRNNAAEVEEILIRLNMENVKEKLYDLQILENTTKRNATLPKHIPKQGILKDIFTYYIDLRKPPKKLFLKALIPFTNATEEIHFLERICSPKGSNEYANFITGKAQTLLGLLNRISSCNPPIEVILEHSLPLQPRYYSISSSPLENALHITFFIVENDDGTKGVCTGWLEDIIKNSSKQTEKVPIYFRKPNNFRMPTDKVTPLIMISTGTGIAPFRGFLDYRQKMKMNDNNCDMGSAYLFYGCRYPDRDFLYHDDLKEYLKKDVLTKLYTAFSRSTEKKWYVQDEMNKNGEDLVNNILRSSAVVYVCGDTKTMMKGVKDALVHNLIVHGHLKESAAKDYLDELMKENRFITDCWS